MFFPCDIIRFWYNFNSLFFLSSSLSFLSCWTLCLYNKIWLLISNSSSNFFLFSSTIFILFLKLISELILSFLFFFINLIILSLTFLCLFSLFSTTALCSKSLNWVNFFLYSSLFNSLFFLCSLSSFWFNFFNLISANSSSIKSWILFSSFFLCCLSNNLAILSFSASSVIFLRLSIFLFLSTFWENINFFSLAFCSISLLIKLFNSFFNSNSKRFDKVVLFIFFIRFIAFKSFSVKSFEWCKLILLSIAIDFLYLLDALLFLLWLPSEIIIFLASITWLIKSFLIAWIWLYSNFCILLLSAINLGFFSKYSLNVKNSKSWLLIPKLFIALILRGEVILTFFEK